jgi:hypothetical protein
MNKLLFFFLFLSASIYAQNKVIGILPDQHPNYISLDKLQMFVVQSTLDKETTANIEVKISEKNKTLALAEIKNYKLTPGHNTLNLDPYFVAVDKKKGAILRKGFKLEEGNFVISAHIAVMSGGSMTSFKDSIVRIFPDRGPIKTILPVNNFEFEETPNVFVWESLNPIIQDATYRLSIYEMKEKVKPEEAVAKGAPIFTNTTNYSNQISLTGNGNALFKKNGTYCWMITLEVGDIVLKRSDLNVFKIKKLSPEQNYDPVQPVLIDLTKPEPNK